MDEIYQVNAINELIDYQTDAVVSRTLVKKEKGTVTLFAFDKDQGLSEHSAPFDALVQVTDGEGEIIISGNSNIVKAGEIILMPANEPHAVKAVTPFKMMLIMIRE
ncbi:MAG: cupin domain-containing protein [FCB group bacterium]|nr:cupin domain-containing protein [FCB group bacterium]